MLNRRILRVKAMQALFATSQAELSSIDYAKDIIKDRFAPDLNAPEKPDLKLLEEQKQKALDLFGKYVETKKPVKEVGVTAVVSAAVKEASDVLEKQKDRDRKHFLKYMLEDVSDIFKWYVYFLRFPAELSFFFKKPGRKPG